MKKKTNGKKILISLLLFILPGIITGCNLKKHEAFAESSHLTELSVSEVYDKMRSMEDFWVFMGHREDQSSIDFEWKLVDKLDQLSRDIYFMDTAVEVTDYETIDLAWDQLGFDVEEEVNAVLHISNGYRISRYEITDKKQVKSFYDAYSVEDITVNDHIEKINAYEYLDRLATGEEMWVYFGRPTCVGCRMRYRKVVNRLEEIDKDLLYVLTGKEFLDEDEVQIIDQINEELGTDEIPMILHVKDNKLIQHYSIGRDEDFDAFKKDYLEIE